MLRIDILTPFPKMVKSVVGESIIGRSKKKGLVDFHIHNLFDFSDLPHNKIDDYPFFLRPLMVFMLNIKSEIGIFERANEKYIKRFLERSQKLLEYTQKKNLEQVSKISKEQAEKLVDNGVE